jgi:hypothetical protein
MSYSVPSKLFYADIIIFVCLFVQIFILFVVIIFDPSSNHFDKKSCLYACTYVHYHYRLIVVTLLTDAAYIIMTFIILFLTLIYFIICFRSFLTVYLVSDI